MKKLGFQEIKGKRNKYFDRILIDIYYNGNNYDIYPQYCESHHFFYDRNVEMQKLYNAEPCIFTDNRYHSDFNNFFYQTTLYFNGKKPISLKSCIRRINKSYNIPKGTIIKLDNYWYYNDKKSEPSYFFKVKKENIKKIKYEINKPSFKENFTDCKFSMELTNKLRANGFLVKVYKKEEHDYAIAYGHNKMIGFSSYRNEFLNYQNGIDNILYDVYGEFDKWSRSKTISKDFTIDEIINKLLND